MQIKIIKLASSTAWSAVKLLSLLLYVSVAAQTNTCSVTLAWDASPETNVAKYVLYQGPASGSYNRQIEVTNRVNGVLTTTNKVEGLLPASTYYFVVTARSTTGLESPPSNEIAYTTPAVLVPPTNLRVVATNQSWTVTVNLEQR